MSTNYSEQREEAIRLTRVLQRSVEVDAVTCDCDYHKNCGRCAGEGTWYGLVFAYCGHDVEDLNSCEENDCAAREKPAVAAVDPFAKLAEPMKSYREFVSEQVEEEAVA